MHAAAIADLDALAERIRRLAVDRADTGRRLVVGIAGPPGAGKSTVADALMARLGPAAALVAMDGFHLAQSVLAAHGTASVKGAPETFDAAGYLALLRRLVAVPRDEVYAPRFDRGIEEPIAGAVEIGRHVDIVVTEGNYLLLDTGPWSAIRDLVDETYFLSVPEHERLRRLIARHVEFGRTVQAATERATHGSDARNASLITGTAARADLVIDLG